MILTDQVNATQDQINTLMESFPENVPLTMVNIIRFRDKTPGQNETGAAAFGRYANAVTPLMKKVGAVVLWSGLVRSVYSGDPTNQPHMVSLVKYPSTAKFLELIQDPLYQEQADLRTVSLEYAEALATTEFTSNLD